MLEIEIVTGKDWQLFDFHTAKRLLTVEELGYCEGLTATRRRMHFLAGRLLVRQMLSRIYGGAMDSWGLTAASGIKPVVCGYPDIHFSISHSHETIVCGVSELPLGVDVETVKFGRDLFALAKLCCHANECAILQLLNEPERTLTFTRYWALKEAVLKQQGQGIDLQQMCQFHFISSNANANAATLELQSGACTQQIIAIASPNCNDLCQRYINNASPVLWQLVV